MHRRVLTSVFLGLMASSALAETIAIAPVEVTEWKAVYGRIEARDRVPARARIGGTLVELAVSEGDVVTEGQLLATIVDEKLGFQIAAIAAQQQAVSAQLDNAKLELKRGEDLLKQGVTTVQRLDALRTQVDVLAGQIAALDAQAELVQQSQTEGKVLAPAAGRVLDAPVSQGAVVMPGEPVATLSVGGTFLRLAVPERHATALHEGDTILIDGAAASGRLAKVYPLIENGRVVADVEVTGLSDQFIDARVLVRLPVGTHQGLMVPATAVVTRSGLDFVAIEGAAGTVMRAVVPGEAQEIDGVPMVEIRSGLVAGDRVMAQAPAAAEHGNE
jgi:RND family efflux transporter MFP subunit